MTKNPEDKFSCDVAQLWSGIFPHVQEEVHLYCDEISGLGFPKF